MRAKFCKIFILSILMFSSVYSQKDVRDSNSQKVKSMLADFNKSLFLEMNPSKAVKNHVYLNEVDSIDSKYGLESDFLEITERFKEENKLTYYVADFYSNNILSLIQIRIGQKAVRNNTEFVDGEMASDKNISRIYKQILTEARITEDELDKIGEPDDKNIDLYKTYTQRINKGIKRKINRKIVATNLEFLNKYRKITKVIFEGRDYYKAKNNIFVYIVTFKSGIPKIMKINRI